jgi:hypothetical protein
MPDIKATIHAGSTNRVGFREPVLGRISFVLLLEVLLAGCGSGVGNANLGPDPGGGFYCAHNAYEGCANP